MPLWHHYLDNWLTGTRVPGQWTTLMNWTNLCKKTWWCTRSSQSTWLHKLGYVSHKRDLVQDKFGLVNWHMSILSPQSHDVKVPPLVRSLCYSVLPMQEHFSDCTQFLLYRVYCSILHNSSEGLEADHLTKNKQTKKLLDWYPENNVSKITSSLNNRINFKSQVFKSSF